PETDHIFQLDVAGQDIAGAVLKPWDQRKRTTALLQPAMQQAVNHIAGQRVVAFQPASLPGSSGLPVQFVINTTNPFQPLNDVAQELLQKAIQSGLFIYLDSDLRIDQPLSAADHHCSKSTLHRL